MKSFCDIIRILDLFLRTRFSYNVTKEILVWWNRIEELSSMLSSIFNGGDIEYLISSIMKKFSHGYEVITN
jgi:hypothetical protein